jgi:nitric-oxide synthase, bacterial
MGPNQGLILLDSHWRTPRPGHAGSPALGCGGTPCPVISGMCQGIGGAWSAAAPCSGWHMCTETGSRDLGDTCRYDQLPVIARHIGLYTASDRSLRKDKAMTELSLAVLHSLATADVTISDHHTESVRFLRHIEREDGPGRACPAGWTWIVLPGASSATTVFHRSCQDFGQAPDFFRQGDASHQRTCALGFGS